MQEANKEKVINLVSRDARGLPVSQDLPRLLRHITLFGGKTKLFPKEDETTHVRALFQLLVGISDQLVGDHKDIDGTFWNFFKENSLPQITKTPESIDDRLKIPTISDEKIKLAIKFILKSFLGSTTEAKILFILTNPSCKIEIFIKDNQIQISDSPINTKPVC
jgi:hypothetical protein